MDQCYSECKKHNAIWETITNGENCPFCKLEKLNNLKESLARGIPIEEWGDRTGLKQTLEIHRDYGDDIVRLVLITFREYLRDNLI